MTTTHEAALILNALIIESDRGMRSKLKQTTHASSEYRSAHTSASLREGMSVLQTARIRFDVVFVSNHFGSNEVALFIQEAKASDRGADCAYIVIFRG
ncbi:MAG: hypothetical protein KDD69_14585, partial [Bdellovibrionales bacterium]|nr:hypothetical protein [Bdellovibrionales bacterium]